MEDEDEEQEQEDDIVELHPSAEIQSTIGDGGRQSKLTDFFHDDESIHTVAAPDNGTSEEAEVESVGELIEKQ